MKPKNYSVEKFLESIQNIQTKAKCLEWLRKRDAAQPHVGFIYQRGVFEQKYIY